MIRKELEQNTIHRNGLNIPGWKEYNVIVRV